MHARQGATAPLVSLLLLPAALVLAQDFPPNCRAPEPYVPGARERCDVEASCSDYCARNHLSFDFLCCDAQLGWIAVHITNPIIFHLFFQDPLWTVALVAIDEVLEFGVSAIFRGSVVPFSGWQAAESATGALLGDVLINGGLGLLIAFYLTAIFESPAPLVSSGARARAYNATHKHDNAAYYRAFLVLTWLLHQFLFLFIHLDDGSPAGTDGLLISTIAQAVLLFIVYPFMLFGSPNARDDALLWAPGYPRWRRIAFFYAWGVVMLLIHVPLLVGGGTWLANDWYISWAFGGGTALLLAIVAVGVESYAGRGRRILLHIGLALLALGLGGLLAYGIADSSDGDDDIGSSAAALLVLGAVLFIAAILWLAGLAMYVSAQDAQPAVVSAPLEPGEVVMAAAAAAPTAAARGVSGGGGVHSGGLRLRRRPVDASNMRFTKSLLSPPP
jgi:hypothetical protein